jgi:hypothetical protein
MVETGRNKRHKQIRSSRKSSGRKHKNEKYFIIHITCFFDRPASRTEGTAHGEQAGDGSIAKSFG